MLDNKIFYDIKKSFEEKDLPNLEKWFDLLLKKVKDTSYLDDKTFFHPLGFIYCKLFEFPNLNSLRIHIWDKERWYQEPLMDIHNHFYTVNSYIISGKMTNNLYRLNPDKAPNYAVYVGSYNSKSDRTLKKTDKLLHAEITDVQEIKARNLYQITTDKLHSSSIPMDKFTCTLVYTSDPGNPEPLVLGPISGDEEYHYANTLVDKQTVSALIEQLTNR